MISFVAFGGHGDDRAFAGADHGEVGHRLVVHRILRHEEHRRRLLVNQRDRPVLHFRRGITLGVDVGNLLELERAFERDGKGVAAAEEEEVVGLRIFQRELS